MRIPTILLAMLCASASITRGESIKPWVADVVSFQESKPGARYIVASSSRTCVTQAEATAEARTAAATSVFELLKPTLGSSFEAGQTIKSIERQLVRIDLVVDRDVQRIERPYATLWQESQLLDVSPKRLDSILSELRRATRRMEMVKYARVIGGGVALVGVGLFYRLFNAFTRGYFVGRLRVAALAAGAVVLAAASAPWPI